MTLVFIQMGAMRAICGSGVPWVIEAMFVLGVIGLLAIALLK